jgi:hypothetical protein
VSTVWVREGMLWLIETTWNMQTPHWDVLPSFMGSKCLYIIVNGCLSFFNHSRHFLDIPIGNLVDDGELGHLRESKIKWTPCLVKEDSFFYMTT